MTAPTLYMCLTIHTEMFLHMCHNSNNTRIKVIPICRTDVRHTGYKAKWGENKGKALLILTPSAISKSGTGLLLQLETTILSPAAEAVARYLSLSQVKEHNCRILVINKSNRKFPLLNRRQIS